MLDDDQGLGAEQDRVRRLRAGDHRAFEAIFLDYCQPLVAFAHRIVMDQPVAENIVQDVFLRIWQNRDRLDPMGSLKSYLYTAVKNQALNHLRHSHVEERDPPDDNIEDDLAETPETIWSRRELVSAIHSALEELPRNCRTIFTMHRYDCLTYSEIANILDLSIKTVGTQMGRALKKLRRSLGHLI